MKWPVGKLSEIAKVTSGYAFKSEWFGVGQDRVVRIGDLQDGRIDLSSSVTVDGSRHKVGKQFKIQSGDILMALSGATVGKIAVAEFKDEGCYLNQRVASVRATEAGCPAYLKYIFSGPPLQKLLLSAGGAAQPNLSPRHLAEMEIPLPPLPEQKRIAAILDKADTIRRKRQQAIKLADEFLRSVFLDMFGDPVSNPKGWEVRELQSICIRVIDCPHSTPQWTASGIVCLRTSNVTKGGWNWDDKRFVNESSYKERSKRAELKESDIILSREGTVGVAALVPAGVKMCMGQRLVQLRSDIEYVYPEFLLFLLIYELDPDRISKIMAGSTSKHLNVKDLRMLKIMVPPKEIQRKFVAHYKKVKDVERSFEDARLKVDRLLASLNSEAFRGALSGTQ